MNEKDAEGPIDQRVNYNKLILFTRLFPRPFDALTAERNSDEVVLSMICDLFDHRIIYRNADPRKNEVRCKQMMFKI